jgi:anti-sigma factor RsiW
MSTHTCEQTSGELVAFLDGELGAEERRTVADHLATCLTCRREMEHLTSVQRMVDTLPRIEPSASFADDFWRRVAAEPTPIASRRRRGSVLRWAIPALAAAAVLAFALRSQLETPSSLPAAPRTRVAAAPAAPAKVAVAPAAERAKSEGAEPAPQVANVDSLRPEDLPPELLEHPELFLRLPVVRRLEKLEYLGSTEDRPSGDGGAG